MPRHKILAVKQKANTFPESRTIARPENKGPLQKLLVLKKFGVCGGAVG
jgi:hypothetical protein